MKENKNNELQKDSLEQVAGGGCLKELKALNQELITLSEELSDSYRTLEQALEGIKSGIPGSGVTVGESQANIAKLQGLISDKIKQRNVLLKSLGMS